jgi:hypothetical protein
MKRWLKRIGLGVLVVVLVVGIGTTVFAWTQVSAFDASVDHVYDVPVPNVAHSTDAAVIARGKHLAESLAACATAHCHGADLGGGEVTDMGPLGVLSAPNISPGGVAVAYSDGELARLIRHGVKKDGRGVRMMPCQDINFVPDDDVLALVSFVRSVPAVTRAAGPGMQVKTLGKVLDRQDKIPLDVARRIDHAHIELAPPPSPTLEYGKFIGRGCKGCHGDHYSGGPIPGAPPSMPIPLNITPDPTGLAGWSFADFDKVLTTGTRKDGRKLDPMMPFESLSKMDDTEKHALWAFLQSLPPVKSGSR